MNITITRWADKLGYLTWGESSSWGRGRGRHPQRAQLHH